MEASMEEVKPPKQAANQSSGRMTLFDRIVERLILVCLVVLLLIVGFVIWTLVSSSRQRLLLPDSVDYRYAVTALQLPEDSKVLVALAPTNRRIFRVKVIFMEKDVAPFLKNSIETQGDFSSTGQIEDFSFLDESGGPQLDELPSKDLRFADFKSTVDGVSYRGSYIHSSVNHTFWIRIRDYALED